MTQSKYKLIKADLSQHTSPIKMNGFVKLFAYIILNINSSFFLNHLNHKA